MISFRPGDMCIFSTIEEIMVNKVGKIIKSKGNMTLVQTSNGDQEWVQANNIRIIRKRQNNDDGKQE